jgi:hypothetical protein
MSDQKHFNYDGHVDLRNQNDLGMAIKVTDVEFLTPARVNLSVNGKETSVMVNIDIINRKVYDTKGNTMLSDLVFNYLDAVNTLPEDFFAAPEDIQERANDMQVEQARKTEEILGEQHE